jgi:hypothetical protein
MHQAKGVRNDREGFVRYVGVWLLGTSSHHLLNDMKKPIPALPHKMSPRPVTQQPHALTDVFSQYLDKLW